MPCSAPSAHSNPAATRNSYAPITTYFGLTSCAVHLIPLSACTPCHPCPLGPDRAGGCSACARGRGAARGCRQPDKTARHGRAHFRDAQPTKPVGALLCFEIRLALSEFAALAVIVSRGRCLLGLVACLFVAARCFACRCSVSTSTSSFTPPRPTSAATTQPHTESCARAPIRPVGRSRAVYCGLPSQTRAQQQRLQSAGCKLDACMPQRVCAV